MSRICGACSLPRMLRRSRTPIRPEEYIEINNFYTMTVYEKGAEVIRMFSTLMGAEDVQEGYGFVFFPS